MRTSLRMCKQLNDALISIVVARMGVDIHNLISKSTMIDAGLQEQRARDISLQASCNQVIAALGRYGFETGRMRNREMEVTPLERSAKPGASSELQCYDEYDDNDANSSPVVIGRCDSDQPKIKTFHHLCLRGLEILAQISSLKEFGTYLTRLETWSFGLMGRTDEHSAEMSLDFIFWPGDESFWPFWTSDVHSVAAGYSMIVDVFIKILLYLESLLITIQPDSSDAVSYLTLLQDFLEIPMVADRSQKVSMHDLDEVGTLSNGMICVSGIEAQIWRLYDMLPAIGSARQVYCFAPIIRNLGHSKTSSRGLVRGKAKCYEDESESQDLIEFNARLSEAIADSLKGKKEEDIRKEAELFEKINDQLHKWKEDRRGELTVEMMKTLRKMRERLQNLQHDLKMDTEGPAVPTMQGSLISHKLVSEARREVEIGIEDLFKLHGV